MCSMMLYYIVFCMHYCNPCTNKGDDDDDDDDDADDDDDDDDDALLTCMCTFIIQTFRRYE